ncbi:hypothetical protein LINPERHAP2_LOCUS12115 [Linum perenne]
MMKMGLPFFACPVPIGL